MRVVDNAPLAPLTTLRLGGRATRLVSAERERDVVDAVREIDARGEPLLVLGGGSNLVVADAGFDGTVVRMGTRGRTNATDGDRVLVSAQAGEPWDAFVAAVVEEGLAGVECLAGIPGLVGAVPMQNVGAYGQDVSETIVSLRAYDRHLGEIVELRREACAFAYRSSAFRGKDRHVILEVTFALERSAVSRPIRYAELARALGVVEGTRAPLAAVRSTVVELRRKKGMVLDPSDPDTTSAGSFFTNPIVSAAELASLRARVEGEGPMPVFPEPDGRFKVSAGWLIERAGFVKGFAGAGGRVAVSSKHALALTHRGGGTTGELVALARQIRDGVEARFGVTLENEPVFVGARL
ncbi:MAG: UDP-N-acetylmuramate dehydrogenase [Labilithrix sp.]|nr:UDP-N-acetylmuramate dehydrogenase [Labilithrix sp.]